MTIKSTYSLDVESVRALEALAHRWNVSKSEVLRRAIRIAATDRDGSPPVAALTQLQHALRARQVNVTQWVQDLKAERGAAARWWQKA